MDGVRRVFQPLCLGWEMTPKAKLVYCTEIGPWGEQEGAWEKDGVVFLGGGRGLPRLIGTHRPQEADINYKWLARAGLEGQEGC